jgi:ABC-2 type transport system permease protein
MKILSVFNKSMKENLRDWKILILTLTFAPAFVFLMYSFYGNAPTTYKVLVYNQDQPVKIENGAILSAGNDLIDAMMRFSSPDDAKLLSVAAANDIADAKKMVRNKEADMLLVIPGDFSQVIAQYRQGEMSKRADIQLFGTTTNPKYIMAATFTYGAASEYAAAAAGTPIPINLVEEFLEKTQVLSDFDYMVPGLIVLSIIMILFTAAASIIKEIDRGTIIRLRLSRLTSFEFLCGISLVQVIITVIAMALTLLAALALGYKPAGSMIDVLFIGVLASLSIVAISLIVSSFLTTIFDLMTIGCFPFFILMFFSGGMFPLPQINLFTMGGHVFNITDILPTSHVVSAFNKIMNFGLGLTDVSFEILAILVLTGIYFAVGVWLFQRRHMNAAG